MALNQSAAVADGGSGGKKKKTAEVDNQNVSSSGREHGGSSGTFDSPSLNKDGSGTQKSGDFSKTTGTQKTPNTTTTAPGGSGGGGGGSSGGSSASAPSYDTSVPSVFGDTVDPELYAQYQNAMAALEGMKGKAPTYGNQYDAQIQSLYQQIVGRDPFKYDQKTDPLYQQYVQDYVTQGKMAMRDTMGKAAGLTGGYGSSYGQAVGQQMYDQYLQNLADVLPETYGMALDAYNAEGNRLNQNLSTTMGLEQSDYAKYLDQLNQYNVDLNRAQTDADNWYDRLVADEKKNYNRQLDQYDMQKDAYNRLLGLMATGYRPSKEEYNAAGLSEAQGESIRAAYAPAPASSGGGGGGTRAAASTQAADTAFENALLSALGGGNSVSKSTSGGTKKNGTNSQAAAAVANAVNKIKNAIK